MSYSNKTHVILIAHEDSDSGVKSYYVETEDIVVCKKNEEPPMMIVHYRRGTREAQIYTYPLSDVVILQNPVVFNPDEYTFRHQGEEQTNVYIACHFEGGGFDYWTLAYKDHRHDLVCPGNEMELFPKEKSMDRKDVLDYMEKMAYFHGYSLRNDDRVILGDQYKVMRECKERPLLDAYLHPIGFDVSIRGKRLVPIFPFGANRSQIEAVRRALENRISVIQGPPGTGKTQTILNLIANLVIRGKTVLGVAGSNAATKNIVDKLQDVTLPQSLGGGQINLSFFVAFLGNNKNKSKFIKNQDTSFCCPDEWGYFIIDHQGALMEIDDLLHRLEPLYELDVELHRKMEELHKVKLLINDDSVNQNELVERKASLEAEICDIKKSLHDRGYKELNERLQSLSMGIFLQKLYDRYGRQHNRPMFSEKDLDNGLILSNLFLAEYPVVLSSAYSSKKSLDKDVLYDYLIVDEASQVDVASGTLSISCARNAVIVGDAKQLRNVIKESVRYVSQDIFDFYCIPDQYNYATHNILQSVLATFSNVPETLLREHYRSHPKIIGFCNRMFYDNKLVAMTEDHDEKDVLCLIQTAPGYHFFDFRNQREEVEMAAFRKNIPYSTEEIGIITPFNNQRKELEDDEFIHEDFWIDTIHSFQGRQMPAIILSTVVDKYDDFVNDAALINVAVSRAEKRFILVTSGNEENAGTLRKLVDYIREQKGCCIKGEIRSYFDLLFDRYSDELAVFQQTHNHIPAKDAPSPAEDIIYGVICDVLREFQGLSVQYENKLSDIFFDTSLLSDEDEIKYVRDPQSHVDFLIKDNRTQAPILGIEVHGLHYHLPGTIRAELDDRKESIFGRYRIPLLSLTTKFSINEYEVIRDRLLKALE